MQIHPLLFIAVGLAGVFLNALWGRRKKWLGYLFSCLACGALLLLSIYAMNFIRNLPGHVLIYNVAGWPAPMGIPLVFDSLSTLMLVLVNLVSLVVAVYSLNYIKRYTDNWKFYTLFLMMLTGLNGVIISGDIFSLYVFLEIASISAYALVAFGTEAEDLEASFKYLAMCAMASVFIILGIGLLYSYTSTLSMADIALVLAGKPSGLLIGFVTVLFIVGFGLKAAIVPFHAWLPDAHPSAPAPISAMLSGVVIKTLGVYALARIFFNVLGVTNRALAALLMLGLFSMALGAFLAVAQKDIKRMLAYSSISQIGYIIFALGIGTPLAVAGALFHVFNHTVAKALLFLNSGAVEYATSTRDMENLGGLKKRMPVTAATSLIGSLSISGIPPLGGFWSKLIIIVAAVESGHIIMALIAVIISVVTLVYYLKFQGKTFFGSLRASLETVREVPLSMSIAVVILALVCVLAGLVLLPQMRPLLAGATNALLPGSNI
jgi:multicomponent Na+:H+ antiporter subunit D